jgi:hypothetical protein
VTEPCRAGKPGGTEQRFPPKATLASSATVRQTHVGGPERAGPKGQASANPPTLRRSPSSSGRARPSHMLAQKLVSIKGGLPPRDRRGPTRDRGWEDVP